MLRQDKEQVINVSVGWQPQHFTDDKLGQLSDPVPCVDSANCAKRHGSLIRFVEAVRVRIEDTGAGILPMFWQDRAGPVRCLEVTFSYDKVGLARLRQPLGTEHQVVNLSVITFRVMEAR